MPESAGKPPHTAPSPRPRRRGGRPSLDEAGQLRDRILDAATELLLRDGYGATSIESIADRAGVSKRTFYSRFTDKPALMSAVVARIIDTQRPSADAPLIAGETLEAMLRHLAAVILRAALTPQLLALHRLIVAESQRFPDLATAVARAGGREEAIGIIGELLLRHAGAAALTKATANFAAEQFLQLIVSLPQMRALGLGTPMNPRELDAWARRSVAIFLGGIAGLSRAR